MHFVDPTSMSSCGHQPEPLHFGADHVVEPDRDVLFLRGDLDLEAERWLQADCSSVSRELHRPTVIDCSAVTFIDCAGIRALQSLLAPPCNRLANLPPHVSRLLRLAGLDVILDRRVRHDVAIATYDGLDVVCAARISELFELANREGCSYDVSSVPFDATTCVASPLQLRWHCLIVPPLDRCVGLSMSTPLVRWARTLASSSQQVVAVGTGMFVLAAGGHLDGRLVAARSFEARLAATAPRAEQRDATSVVDGSLSTAIDADSAMARCAEIIRTDYGEHVWRRVQLRLASVGMSTEHTRDAAVRPPGHCTVRTTAERPPVHADRSLSHRPPKLTHPLNSHRLEQQ